jgi:hypothetical protein
MYQPIDWEAYLLQTLADANRKLGQVKGEKCYLDYADCLENAALNRSPIIREAQKIVKEVL